MRARYSGFQSKAERKPSSAKIAKAEQLKRETLPPIADRLRGRDATGEDMFDCYTNGLLSPKKRDDG